MITGKTTNFGVIGNPIGHSLSPAMQNAGIRAAGLDYVYIAMPVLNEELAQAVTGLKALGFRGFNVTIPHKQAIMPYLDEIHEDAQIIGAVNAVLNDNGHLIGYNTDVIGFIQGMKDRGFQPAGRQALLLGAGGAARAIIWGLIKENVKSLTIGVRNAAKAQQVAEYFGKYMDIHILDWHSAEFAAALGQAELLINSTPLGMVPRTDAMPPVDWSRVDPQAFVYDIIYTPAETLFLKAARQHGCRTLNGEAMLVGQGAEAFRLWTGNTLPPVPMAEALRAALQQQK
ncbi:MAG: shikimate dehydrogenase [Anaerovibrio sp.]|nr:shikimate dehydrogenase [Anaerovibrio sp.]